MKKEKLITKRTYFKVHTVIFHIYNVLVPSTSTFSRFFAFKIVQNGLADFSWPGTAGALVPGNKGPGSEVSFFLALVAPSSFCWTPPLLVMAVCASLALVLSSFSGPATVSSARLPDLHDVLQLLPQRLHPVVQVAL